ncbi:MAG: sugar phosphate nucleotidyltransferase [Candidatus Staskawiczbacteria bacterium]|nr:sugar phosphate nucleotidyltransferase [Candidatus Staskawiczbacteria bacterium]
MIKKVVIAAAGQGTRMLNLSKDKPKHLISVNGRPFLSYLFDSLFLAGYKDIILVTGYMQEAMDNFKKDYTAPNKGKIKIEIVNQSDCPNLKGKYGTACPLMCLNNKVKDQFLYIYGDNLFSVEDLKAMNVDDEFCYVAGVKQERPEKYGVLVENSDGLLEKIVEKPKEFVGNLVNAGLYKFTSKVFEKIPMIEKSLRGEYEITDAVSLLAKDRKVKIKELKDCWYDFGSPEDIEKVSKFLNENNKGK